MDEREKTSEKRRRKTTLKEKFLEIVSRLEEVYRKLEAKLGLSPQEEQALETEKIQLEAKKENLIREFFQTDFGRLIRAKIEDYEQKLEFQFQIVEQASDMNSFNAARRKLNQLIGFLEKDLSDYKDDASVAEKHQGIGAYQLRELLKRAQRRRDELVLQRLRLSQPSGTSPLEDLDLRHRMAERSQELEGMLIKDIDNSQVLSDLSHLQMWTAERGSPYELSPEDRQAVIRGGKDRERVFLKIRYGFGLDEDRHFRDTSMTIQSQWIDFVLLLNQIDKKALKRYLMLFSFEESVHNLSYFLSGQASISEIPKILSSFQSKLLDMACREEGTVAAFRAWEQAFEMMKLVDKKIDSKRFYNPDTTEEWVDDFVTERVRETLISDLQRKRHLSREQAEEIYKKEYLDFEASIIETGRKIFIFSLRGEEIQASIPELLQNAQHWSPWHEDFWRRFNPLSLPLRFWGEVKSVNEFLNRHESGILTSLYYFYTGGERQKFETIRDYQEAMKKAIEEGKVQLNLFDIGGIFSQSDWRATEATLHVPSELWRFMGVELDFKKLKGELKSLYQKRYQQQGLGEKEAGGRALQEATFDARRQALAHCRIRNPFRLFLLASDQDQNEILRACGVDISDPQKARKEFFEKRGVYAAMSQALQNLVYEQQQQLKTILSIKDPQERQRLARQFLEANWQRGLNFDFVQDPALRADLENFVLQIQNYFQPGETDDLGNIKEEEGRLKKGNENFERLVHQDIPFCHGTDDILMELMDFSSLGDAALQRRFRDIGDHSNAVEAFWGLVSNLGSVLQKEDKIIEALSKISQGISGYNAETATTKMLMLTDRIIEMIRERPGYNLLPWPLHQWVDKYALTSRAEKLFGQTHMSMDKQELRLFIENLIGAGIFKTMDAREVRKFFYDKYKLHLYHLWGQKAMRYGPAVIVGITAFAFLTVWKAVKEDLQKLAEET